MEPFDEPLLAGFEILGNLKVGRLRMIFEPVDVALGCGAAVADVVGFAATCVVAVGFAGGVVAVVVGLGVACTTGFSAGAGVAGAGAGVGWLVAVAVPASGTSGLTSVCGLALTSMVGAGSSLEPDLMATTPTTAPDVTKSPSNEATTRSPAPLRRRGRGGIIGGG